MSPAQTPAALAAATPATRDRYVDLLRGASIVVVVLGHWLMAVVTWDGGGVRTGNLLAAVPALQPATWLLQVMPLFFVVGGFADSGSWRSTVRGAGGYADFVRHRLDRLLHPLWVFLAVWLAVAGTFEVVLGTPRTVRVVTLIAVQPLWFVGLYALAVALTPPTLAAHRRYGAAVPVGLAAVVGLADLLRLGAHLPGIGYLNYAAVWLFAHQLGYFYRDGRFARLRPATLVPAAGLALALLVALTTFGPYPRSMVGLPGDRISNMSPPSLCIVVLTGWLVALALVARAPARRWLARPAVWLRVVTVNSVIMTVFLWHLTALVMVVAVCYGMRVASPPPATVTWWALRPGWLLALALVLTAVVALLGRFEQPRGRPVPSRAGRGGARTTFAAIGVGYVVLGLSGLALTGLWGLAEDRHVPLLHLSVNPLLSLVHLVAGAALVRLAVRPRPGAGLGAVAVLFVALAALEPPLARSGHNVMSLDAADAATHLATAALLLGTCLRVGRATWWVARDRVGRGIDPTTSGAVSGGSNRVP